jgi:hypothetical protein
MVECGAIQTCNYMQYLVPRATISTCACLKENADCTLALSLRSQFHQFIPCYDLFVKLYNKKIIHVFLACKGAKCSFQLYGVIFE